MPAFNANDYIPVSERIEKFYAAHPKGRILTTIVDHYQETGFILMRAEVFREPDDALPAATGHAYEMKSGGHVQQGSYIEVCETSSVGRALANLGLEVKRQNGQQQQRRQAAPPARREPEPQQQPEPESKPKATVEELHKRIHTWRGKLKSEGFMTFTQLDGLLMQYGRKKVEDLTQDQALSHGKELKGLYEAKVQERAEQVAKDTRS